MDTIVTIHTQKLLGSLISTCRIQTMLLANSVTAHYNQMTILYSNKTSKQIVCTTATQKP